MFYEVERSFQWKMKEFNTQNVSRNIDKKVNKLITYNFEFYKSSLQIKFVVSHLMYMYVRACVCVRV